ncbi:MAG: hypothetical protein H6738_10195 [Alphaproteobacteria bacterium]|nr:hypothetical protein [Alphaproteobacteria bacterium]
MLARAMTVLLIVGAVLGVLFTSLSTFDFVQHLDRQVHAIHCSFVPGMPASTDAESGCHVALMSPWSSILRTWVWGGVPVALPGIPLFAFLAFRGIEGWAARGLRDRAAAGFTFAVSLLPVATSLVFGTVAILELGTFCKTCAGIYVSSFLCAAGALGTLIGVWLTPAGDEDEEEAPELPEETEAPAMDALPPLWDQDAATVEPEADRPVKRKKKARKAPARRPSTDPAWLTLVVGTIELGGFVLVPFVLYLLLAPDHGAYAGTCGRLEQAPDEALLVPLERHPGGRVTIEVFDPLCPACRGFEHRLGSSGLSDDLDRRAILFPLDNACNWMVTTAMHPGACAISEAVLCAETGANDVIDWAFEHQEEIRAATAKDPGAAAKMVKGRFPTLASCVGSNAVKQKLNRSLRWAVANHLPVLTPQLYVDGTKVCDEDTDLGLDFALSTLLAKGGGR